MRKWIGVVVLSSLLFGEAVAQDPVTPGRNDPVFQRLATVLDKVPAVDVHTHLLKPGLMASAFCGYRMPQLCLIRYRQII